jgi:hypothetical protein
VKFTYITIHNLQIKNKRKTSIKLLRQDNMDNMHHLLLPHEVMINNPTYLTAYMRICGGGE